jgi:hypothetical protein
MRRQGFFIFSESMPDSGGGIFHIPTISLVILPDSSGDVALRPAGA